MEREGLPEDRHDVISIFASNFTKDYMVRSENYHVKFRPTNSAVQEGTRSNRQIGCGVLLL